MIELSKTSGTKRYFFLILVFLIATDVAILLNTPFLRQIFGFFFLTILPGLLILQILKLNKIGSTEKFVLAVGLSISFLMFFGLLINNLSLTLGYKTALAMIPLLISFNLAFIVLMIIGYRINKESTFSLPNIALSTSEKAFLIVPISFPALSIFGMHVMNTRDNNIILIFLLFLIPTYVVTVCFFNHKFPKRIYPVVIFSISISLLLLMSLRSNHILGIDTHMEYYLFQTTLDNLHWHVGIMGNALDACLSISLLPTIYQSILNVSAEFLFKVLYSLIYSVSPLIIYILSKKYIGESYAFLVSFFFMSQLDFFWTPLHARTHTAILFFALVMMVLFSGKIDPLKKSILFIIFMPSCMLSHYSTTYIFFFIMLSAFVGIEILSKKYSFKKAVNSTIVLLFFSMIFFWYSQVTKTAFTAGTIFIRNTLTSLNSLFVEELRSENVYTMLGEGIGEKAIPQKIEFMLTWLTIGFIAIGVITLIRRYKEMSFSELNFKKPDFLKDKFEVEYFIIALTCSGLLVAIVVLPYISSHYGMDRLYTLAITILSVFFVIGGIVLSKNLSLNLLRKVLSKTLRRKKTLLKKQKDGRKDEIWGGKKNASQVRAYLVILAVLIPYFFCTSGVTYQMFDYPQAITLNSEGIVYDRMYVHDQESYSAKWLSHEQQNLKIHADHSGSLRLRSQSGISMSLIDGRSIFKHKKRLHDGYIYLRYYNVVADEFLEACGEAHNMTEYSDIFIKKSKIYDSGGSVIYW